MVSCSVIMFSVSAARAAETTATAAEEAAAGGCGCCRPGWKCDRMFRTSRQGGRRNWIYICRPNGRRRCGRPPGNYPRRRLEIGKQIRQPEILTGTYLAAAGYVLPCECRKKDPGRSVSDKLVRLQKCGAVCGKMRIHCRWIRTALASAVRRAATLALMVAYTSEVAELEPTGPYPGTSG